jgi:hypothetical protein
MPVDPDPLSLLITFLLVLVTLRGAPPRSSMRHHNIDRAALARNLGVEFEAAVQALVDAAMAGGGPPWQEQW